MMVWVKYNLTDFIIVVDFSQDHEYAIGEASAFDAFTEVVFVAIDTVDKDG